ncbi:hypothetical protein GKC34_13845, partial [Lactobacillus salivarius]|nr:hypothetical protein [Ligilactobacillus salivarius]
MKTDNLESLFDVVDKLTLSDGIVQLKPEKLDGNIDDDNDGTTILKKISSFLKKRNSNNYKVKMIMDLLSPIFTKKVLWENNNGESLIKHIFTDIHSE